MPGVPGAGGQPGGPSRDLLAAPEEVISLAVRKLDHGRITLESHVSGYVLTLPTDLLFDALGG